MSSITTIQLQFGTATLDQDGESPLISTLVGTDENNTAVTTTLQDNATLPAYVVSYPLYTVESSVSGSATFHYLIASAT